MPKMFPSSTFPFNTGEAIFVSSVVSPTVVLPSVLPLFASTVRHSFHFPSSFAEIAGGEGVVTNGGGGGGDDSVLSHVAEKESALPTTAPICEGERKGKEEEMFFFLSSTCEWEDTEEEKGSSVEVFSSATIGEAFCFSFALSFGDVVPVLFFSVVSFFSNVFSHLPKTSRGDDAGWA